MRDFDNTTDYLDVRDIISRVEELEDLQTDETAMPEELEELATLSALLADMASNGGDEEWRGDWYPVALIRDSYFTDYAQELLEECGYIPKDFPSWIKIDWEATAHNVRIDYTSTEFDGVTYWFRRC
jgi:hypothetical protein